MEEGPFHAMHAERRPRGRIELSSNCTADWFDAWAETTGVLLLNGSAEARIQSHEYYGRFRLRLFGLVGGVGRPVEHPVGECRTTCRLLSGGIEDGADVIVTRKGGTI
jgi:hypothetical protein